MLHIHRVTQPEILQYTCSLIRSQNSISAFEGFCSLTESQHLSQTSQKCASFVIIAYKVHVTALRNACRRYTMPEED